ncbi:MAG: polymer-forming cytoskeletal protein [Spirochaetales bacterium]
MSASRGIDDSFINSIVGPGTFFRGHLELNGLLRVDGDFSGSIKTAGKVIVGQAGRADCAVEASSVVIGGLFRGEIFATEKVVLLASSVVIGSIIAPRLVAETGVSLHASFRVTGTPIDPATVPSIGQHRKELLLESVRTREGALSGQRERAAEPSDVGASSPKQYERQGQWSG